ncbi:hypothetical protein BGZ58_009914 [Dissophora ornata]|nr:hypothetical protein BGZ58_009914 [Dissophora ornata]
METEYCRIKSLCNLETLAFSVWGSVPDWELRRGMVTGSKSTLRKVELSVLKVRSTECMWSGVGGFDKLDVLRVTRGTIPNSHFASFYQAASLVSELHLIDLQLPWRASDVHSMEQGLSRLKCLDICRAVDIADVTLLEFISQCSSLVSLVLLTNHAPMFGSTPTGTELVGRFNHGSWPHLRSLILDDIISLSDLELSIILRSMTCAETLGLEDSCFGARSLRALLDGHHFETLKVLDLCHARGIESKHILEILSSTPMLEHFMAPLVDAEDIIDGKPWICTRLKTFVVGVESYGYYTRRGRSWNELSPQEQSDVLASRANSSWHLMKALSNLTQLEVLDMRVHWNYYREAMDLDLTLQGRGLEKLGTLKHLRRLLFNAAKDMNQEDIQWMMQNWPKLTCIHGSLSSQAQASKVLKEVLMQHNVCVGLQCQDSRLNSNDRGLRYCDQGRYTDAVRAFHDL